MNVYQMYEANGRKFGFYIQRNSWKTVLAKVTLIEGVQEGQPIPGTPPYHGTPKTAPKVKVEIYRAKVLKECSESTMIEATELSCPGTYAYEMIG